MNNLFYFKSIQRIGGIEQFFYEIAKKYKNKDITILYDDADYDQIKRLSKLVRCIRHKKGQIVKCKRVFLAFNIDAINDIEAEEYIFVFHANFQQLNYNPPIWNPKITKYIAVSKFAAKQANAWLKSTGKKGKAEVCYNPLTLEPKRKVVRLLSACRLEDSTKGGARTQTLINALDRYSEEHNVNYIWTIFTNLIRYENGQTIDMRDVIKSKNVCIMQPRIDIRPYIADSDYVLQLSNDMETYCYTINEALGYGVPVVTTPLTVLKEFPITDNEHITLDFNCENVDDVARQIFEKKVKPFNYTPPEDEWDEILKGKSTYKNKDVKVKCKTYYYDNELKEYIKPGTVFTMKESRANYVEGLDLIEILT